MPTRKQQKLKLKRQMLKEEVEELEKKKMEFIEVKEIEKKEIVVEKKENKYCVIS